MNKKDIPVLTGLRFVAATLVFIFHYAHEILSRETHPFAYFFIRQLNIGVSLFFVLSGFLIAYRYYDGSFAKNELRHYFTKRVARIWPLYYLLLFAQLVLFAFSKVGPRDLPTVLMSATLLKGLHSNYLFTGLAQSWSLTVEEMFYLFAPVCFCLIRFKKIFLFLQVPALIAMGFLLVWLCSNPRFPVYFDSPYYMWTWTFFGRCFEFFVGIFIALAFKNRSVVMPGRPVHTALAGIVFAGLLGLLAFVAYRTEIEKTQHEVARTLLFNFLLPASIGWLFYGLISEASILRRILSTEPLLLLGKSSYAFYLLHVGMIAEVIFFHVVSNMLVFYITMQLLSVAAYKWFEKPVYFFILRKFAGRRRGQIKTLPAAEIFVEK